MKQMRGIPIAVAAILMFAAALRIPGLFTDFWLDEIWSYRLVGDLKSPLGVFTAIHRDGNHWLNSLALYAIGLAKPWWLYRLPSLFAGLVTVAVAGRLASLQEQEVGSVRAGLLAMGLTAVSFPLVLYSTEARGYSMVVLFSLLSFLFHLRFLDEGGRAWKIGYWITSLLGLLSHLSFLILYGAGIFYTLVLLARGNRNARRGLSLHGPLALALLGLYWVDLRHLTVGGGPSYGILDFLVETASLSIGGPAVGGAALVAAGLAVFLFVSDERRRIRRYKEGSAGSEVYGLVWVFYAVGVVGLPLWLILVLEPAFLFPRYFLVPMALFLVAIAGHLAHLGRCRPWVCGWVLAVFLGINLWHWSQFAVEGRGHYREALGYILSGSEAPVVTVGSDFDFRNEMLVDFYRTYLGPDTEKLVYVRRESLPVFGPDWWIAHSQDQKMRPSSVVLDDHRYRLERTFPSSRLSGMVWFVYRRAD
jgi:hypothetical protein